MERGLIGIILVLLLLNCVSAAYIPHPQPSETNSESSTSVGTFTKEVTSKKTPSSTSEGILTTASPTLGSSTKGIQAAITPGPTTLFTTRSSDNRITTAGTSIMSSITTGRATVTFNATTEVSSIMDSFDRKVAKIDKHSHIGSDISHRAKYYPQRLKFLLGSIPVLSGYNENVWVKKNKDMTIMCEISPNKLTKIFILNYLLT
ncbi:unnamed protein product [Orchesella dallaii]|uniref:Uncharacterized protein n=1 Tax=Orchesella dallaii TaxID=48710 RepID=A0ABP1QRM2_9HEXA